MIRIERDPPAFDEFSAEYDEWFDEHPYVFQSEVEAIRRFIPERGLGIEIGVGTGRFASQLGISLGVEPSEVMASIARTRGIEVQQANAEHLPFDADHFDFALMVTILCFVKDPGKALNEVLRILKPGGNIILSIIDRETELGKQYESMKESHKFYQHAHFYSTQEVLQLLQQNGFICGEMCQTIFSIPETMIAPDPIRDGYGEGAFVVINSIKPNNGKAV